MLEKGKTHRNIVEKTGHNLNKVAYIWLVFLEKYDVYTVGYKTSLAIKVQRKLLYIDNDFMYPIKIFFSRIVVYIYCYRLVYTRLGSKHALSFNIQAC